MFSLLACWMLAITTFAGSIQNPIIKLDFPDPMILRGRDGYYYAYSTGSLDREGQRLSVAKSKDFQEWSSPKELMPRKPRWARKSNAFWAPHVVERAGKFYLYFSAIPDDPSMGEFRLGVAIGRSAEGPFTDIGEPLPADGASSNIDAMHFVDPKSGKAFLYWGRDGVIVAQELAEDWVQFAEGSEPIEILPPTNKPYEDVVEGPWVHFADGKYYLFYSGNDCCEDPHYAVMAARADSPLGPFERLSSQKEREDGVILRANEEWLAPGHNAIYVDPEGRAWIVYHAISKGEKSTKSKGPYARWMLLDPIEFRDGWPQVEGESPGMGAKELAK